MTEKAPVVYILDDDRAFCLLLSSVLKRFGATSETFLSSAALKARIQERVPSLCLVDLNVESIHSSLSLVRYLRATSVIEYPIVVASGNCSPSVISDVIESGANDFLTKPLEREVLISKLMRYISSTELEKATMTFPTAPEIELKVWAQADVTLVELDELGIKVSSDSLVSKGMILSMSSDILHEITGSASAIMVTAVKSELDAGTGVYETYFEFDASNHELLGQVRTWLSRKEGSAS